MPDKEAFHSEFNLEDIADKDYEHPQKVWEVFEIKTFGEYHDLCWLSEKLFNLHKDLPFLPDRKKVNKSERLICSIEDKEKYVIHIRALKRALNRGLMLKEVHKIITFNQRAWLKPYIDMSTKKKTLKKQLCFWINNRKF